MAAGPVRLLDRENALGRSRPIGSLGLELLIVNATPTNQDDLEAAFETSVRGGAGGVVVGSNVIFFGYAKQLAALTARYALPTIYVEDRTVREGGLISYDIDQDEVYRLLGNYAGRLFKGEKPADMPVQHQDEAGYQPQGGQGYGNHGPGCAPHPRRRGD
jgi:ABC-type uncharacterized transport system substrate-binding protein